MVKKPCLMDMCSIEELKVQIKRKKAKLNALANLHPTPLIDDIINRLTREIETLEEEKDSAEMVAQSGGVELRGQTQRS